jgi:hypothetical protein
VAADDHDLVGSLAPAQLADHVERVGVGQKFRVHFQKDARGDSAILHALQLVGVLGRNGRRGDLGRAFRIAQRAGMGKTEARRTDGSDQRCRGAERGRARCTGAAELHGLAISGERDVERDDPALHATSGSVELFVAAHDEDIRFDAGWRRPDAVTQTEHHESLPAGGNDLGTLLTPHPVRHLDRLGVDVFKTVPLHFRDRPLDGILQRLRATEPVAKGIADVGEAFPCERRRHRFADQPCRRCAVRLQRRRESGGVGRQEHAEAKDGEYQEKNHYTRTATHVLNIIPPPCLRPSPSRFAAPIA